MVEQVHPPIIGNVLRASTVGFVCGTRSENINHPSFGSFVRVACAQMPDINVIGLIHAISIDDDPMVRQMILANNMNTNAVNDQRINRMVPVEISVLNVGFIQSEVVQHSLPPRPPLSLDPVQLGDDALVVTFTQRLDFLRLVLNANDVPTEELIAAALKHAAHARSQTDQYPFLVTAGQHLASLLSYDLPRLHHLLKLIRPVA